ncbi:MAG: glutaredoxin family protein [Dehalococcoidia bacterium]
MARQVGAVIYTQPHCAPCKQVEQFLEEHAVPFVTRDVTKDPVALNELVERGFMATPVTNIGEQWIAGFQRDELRDAIAATQSEVSHG